MSQPDKIAKLVLDSKMRMYIDNNSTPACWTVPVDMGSFNTNVDDMVFIEIDYVSNIIGSITSTVNPIPNIPTDMELIAYVPQQNSYDSQTQTQTYHLCLLERDFGNTQTVSYSAAPSNIQNPATWQSWSFKHKPSKICCRPEILQAKSLTLALKFLDSSNFFNADVNSAFQYLSNYKVVLSISK